MADEAGNDQQSDQVDGDRSESLPYRPVGPHKREYQVDEGHRMIEAGADVIFGSHAHRLQPMEMYEGKPIFYGLGNFVWPRFSVEGSTTAVAQVVVRPDGSISGRLLPATIVSDGHPVLNASG